MMGFLEVNSVELLFVYLAIYYRFSFFSLELLCIILAVYKTKFYLRLAKLFNFYPYGKT